MDLQLIELATSLNRFRSLTSQESGWLYSAIRREKHRNGDNAKNRWQPKDDLRLKRCLKQHKHPRDIGRLLGRTEDAVWSRIKILRRNGKLNGCSQSPVAQMAQLEG